MDACDDQSPPKFAGRGGAKLRAALEAFGMDVTGLICADFGCNVGGFTDCLLKCGAARVYAVDTGYGELAWRLRKDDRVIVMERTNALYCEAPELLDLVVIDVGWTPQRLIIPAAMRWLRPGGRIVSLLKPRYELAKMQGRRPANTPAADEADLICREVCTELAASTFMPLAAMRSPLLGKAGGAEYFLLLAAGT